MKLLLKQTLIIIGLATLCLPSAVYSQLKESLLLEEIRDAYNRLNYTEAEIKAQTALRDYQRFSPDQLTEIHKILALIYFSQNKTAKARDQFEIALSLTPDLQLDPVFVSPKILDFFNQIKEEWEYKLQESSDAKTEIRYVLVQDPRPAAALRSMILPGWGQLYKGDKTKGKVLITLWSIGLIGSVISHLARENAEDKYLSETNPSKIEARYNSFNFYHNLRNNLLIFTAGVWVYSYIDAIIKERPPSSKKAMLIFPSISPDHTQVNFMMNF